MTLPVGWRGADMTGSASSAGQGFFAASPDRRGE
jgi:hypothetical protein